MEDKKKQDELEEVAPRLYEVGFHLIPTIAEDDVPGVVSTIQTTIEGARGTITDSATPEIFELAYPMSRTIANKKHTFDTAYFGWIKFDVTPVGLARIQEELEDNEHILRFLITKTTADSVLVNQQLESIKKRAEARKESATKDEKKEDSPASEKELDKTIEELVVE